jgi:Raf kinase inhibitor-like YbhB/YbcL family protein
MAFQLKSPAFKAGKPIPRKYTADGDNLSPPLEWTEPPPDTRSFALLVEDPDAPSGTFRHWAVFDIPADQRSLPEGVGREKPPPSTHFAKNDFGRARYDGPKPPEGDDAHHYKFRLAALDASLAELTADVLPWKTDAKAAEVWQTVKPHIIAEADLVGLYQR